MKKQKEMTCREIEQRSLKEWQEKREKEGYNISLIENKRTYDISDIMAELLESFAQRIREGDANIDGFFDYESYLFLRRYYYVSADPDGVFSI